MVFMHVVTVIYAAKLEQVVENVQCKDTTRYRRAELPTDSNVT